MEEIIQIILKWGIPVILTGITGFIFRELKDNKKSNSAVKESMVLLLRSQIVGKAETYMKEGFLPDYARSCMEDLFNQYEILGGNHGVGNLVKQCFDLPPIKLEERK